MAQAIKRGLRQAAYAVDLARDGEEALYQASINDYDAVILDVMIPKRNGFEVCRELRRRIHMEFQRQGIAAAGGGPAGAAGAALT